METEFCFEKTIAILSTHAINRPIRNAARKFKECLSLNPHSFKTGLNINPQDPTTKRVIPGYLSYRENFTMFLYCIFFLKNDRQSRSESYQVECLENDDYLGPEFFLVKGFQRILFHKKVSVKHYEESLQMINTTISNYILPYDERLPWIFAYLLFFKAELALENQNYREAIDSYYMAKEYLKGNSYGIDGAISHVFKIMNLPRVASFYQSKSTSNKAA